MNNSGSCSFGQFMVDQRPRFDNQVKKRRTNGNQVISKQGMIRPDKRKKVKFL